MVNTLGILVWASSTVAWSASAVELEDMMTESTTPRMKPRYIGYLEDTAFVQLDGVSTNNPNQTNHLISLKDVGFEWPQLLIILLAIGLIVGGAFLIIWCMNREEEKDEEYAMNEE